MLTEKDYIYLYPFMSPNEIQAEFGAGSKNARTIQLLYKNKGYLAQRRALKEIVNRSYAIADLEIDAEEWAKYVRKEILKEREFRKQVVHTRLCKVLEMYK